MQQVMPSNLKKLFERRPNLRPAEAAVCDFAADLIGIYRRGGTLFLAGNGGSAADADHICGELLKGFCSERPLPEEAKERFAAAGGEEGLRIAGKLQRGLRAVSLLSHPALMSAFANDVDPGLCFAQQLFALARPGDLFLGISTGGGAENIRNALITAKALGVRSWLLTGNRRGLCEKFADRVIAVPESETYLVQEEHIAIYHAVCLAVEEVMFC